MIPNETASPSQSDEEIKGNYHFAHLMETFDVKRLGEGDPLLGLNLLVVMAVTLGNLARPGSGILTDSGKIIPVGCNLIANGPRITQLIIDEVTSHLSKAQAKILRHAARYERWSRNRDLEISEKGLQSPNNRGVEEQLGFNQGEIALARMFEHSSEAHLFSRSSESDWRQVLASDVQVDSESLVNKLRFFASAAAPRYLVPMLAEAHLDEMMVHLGAASKEDVAPLGAICPSLMDGVLTVGKSGCAIRAKLLVTDRNSTIIESLQLSNENAQWVDQLIWLSDSDCGLPLLEISINKNPAQLRDLYVRFTTAVEEIICQRLNFHSPKPTLIKLSQEVGIDKSQQEWMNFLFNKQPVLPGVGGAGRSFFASLFFGLNLIVASKKTPDGFRYTTKGVFYMARYLINRMAHTRITLADSSEESRKKMLWRKAMSLLANESLDSRTLYRNLRISSTQCASLLFDMQAAGIVKFHKSKWTIHHPGFGNRSSDIPKTIEV